MTTKRQVFYSFHYKPDNWRASQVRNIGVVEGNNPVSDNDWETITKKGEKAIKQWIENQMKYRSCTIVLVGSNAAGRKWINHEIIKSWKHGMGVVGIYVHGLKNSKGITSSKGKNPFDDMRFGDKKFSDMVKCYDPQGKNSQERYAWISKYLSIAVEEAIRIREEN